MRWPYPRTPALGRALPSNYDAGQRVFDERVKARFPIGTREADLLEELKKQGFAVAPSRHDFDHESASVLQGLIFRHVWSVRWRATAGRIDEIWGVYGVIAP